MTKLEPGKLLYKVVMFDAGWEVVSREVAKVTDKQFKLARPFPFGMPGWHGLETIGRGYHLSARAAVEAHRDSMRAEAWALRQQAARRDADAAWADRWLEAHS